VQKVECHDEGCGQAISLMTLQHWKGVVGVSRNGATRTVKL